MTRPATLMLLAALCTGYTQFPELERTQTVELEAADYPALVPIEPILASVTAPDLDPVAAQAGIEARLAALRARANRLRRGVLTDAERRRLEQGAQ